MENVTFKHEEGIPDIIELKNINQSYDKGKVVVIENLSLLIENRAGENQFVTLLGPSGCGKSTLLSFISGLKTPTSGEVKLYGKDSNRDTICGMVFQQYSSFPWLTVLDNVALGLQCQGMGKSARRDAAMDMLKLVHLEKHALKHAKIPNLSGGQLQRVAIARSLVANPKILLMDEPFGALDTETRFEMQDLMQTLVSEKISDTAIILVTHDIQEALYLSDEILLMQTQPGRIVDRIKVNLPANRTKALKRDSKFLKIVYEIEDKMSELVNQKNVDK